MLCSTWFVACCVCVFSPGRKCDPCEQYVRHFTVSPPGFAIQTKTNALSLREGRISQMCPDDIQKSIMSGFALRFYFSHAQHLCLMKRPVDLLYVNNM